MPSWHTPADWPWHSGVDVVRTPDCRLVCLHKPVHRDGHTDGFQIAEEDLRLRGPGDFFGARQHGLPGLKVADLGCDTQLLQEARQAAEQLLAQDPALTSCPATAERVTELFTQQADALN